MLWILCFSTTNIHPSRQKKPPWNGAPVQLCSNTTAVLVQCRWCHFHLLLAGCLSLSLSLSLSFSLSPSTQNAAHVLSCRLGGRGKGRRDQIALQRGCDIINALLHLQQPRDDQSDASRPARQQNAWELCVKPETVEGQHFKTDRPNSCLLTQPRWICLEEMDKATLFAFAVLRWIQGNLTIFRSHFNVKNWQNFFEFLYKNQVPRPMVPRSQDQCHNKRMHAKFKQHTDPAVNFNF